MARSLTANGRSRSRPALGGVGALLQERTDLVVILTALRALRPGASPTRLAAEDAALTRRFQSEHETIRPWRRKRAVRNRERRVAAWIAGPFALLGTAAAVMWPMTAAAPAVVTPSAPLTVNTAGGPPAVGALFSTSGGQLRTHFCTASVVDSPAGNLLITAAHCVNGYSATSPARLAFVPGYDDGTAPYGVWTVTHIFADAAWASAADPDDDVAFLAVAQPGSATKIENITGAERLGIGQPATGAVRVIGYPDTQEQPLSCQNRTLAFSASQLRFDCDGYTSGTSGGPFLTGIDAATGEGTVIGVIGGYQQGGGSPDVSYAARFGQNVQTLYDTAASGS